MKNYIFDIRGLVTLPDFKEKVIDPLRSVGNIRFWSHEDEEYGVELLKETGLEEFSETAIFDDYSRRYTGCLERGWSAPNYIMSRFFPILTKVPLDLNKREQRWLEVMRETQTGSYKHLPILGLEPAILIESDSTHEWKSEVFSDFRKPLSKRRSLSRLAYLETAKKDGYSVILTPEHPTVWDGEGEITGVKQEDVVDELSKRLLDWDGRQMSLDLGSDMGIYKERA